MLLEVSDCTVPDKRQKTDKCNCHLFGHVCLMCFAVNQAENILWGFDIPSKIQ